MSCCNTNLSDLPNLSMPIEYSIQCEGCGVEVRVCDGWNHTPRVCKLCKAERDAKWYNVVCEECGSTVRACRDWEREPRFCKLCRAELAARWYDKPCAYCRERVCRDWDHIPDYHRACGWIEETCEICGETLWIHRDRVDPRRSHWQYRWDEFLRNGAVGRCAIASAAIWRRQPSAAAFSSLNLSLSSPTAAPGRSLPKCG